VVSTSLGNYSVLESKNCSLNQTLGNRRFVVEPTEQGEKRIRQLGKTVKFNLCLDDDDQAVLA
jgi:hypothetical protein